MSAWLHPAITKKAEILNKNKSESSSTSTSDDYDPPSSAYDELNCEYSDITTTPDNVNYAVLPVPNIINRATITTTAAAATVLLPTTTKPNPSGVLLILKKSHQSTGRLLVQNGGINGGNIINRQFDSTLLTPLRPKKSAYSFDGGGGGGSTTSNTSPVRSKITTNANIKSGMNLILTLSGA